MVANTICCDYRANKERKGGTSSDDTVIKWGDTVIVGYDNKRIKLFSEAGYHIILQRLDSIFDKGVMISDRWKNLLGICGYLSIFDVLTCRSLLPTLLPKIKGIIDWYISPTTNYELSELSELSDSAQYLAVFLGYMITLKFDDPKLPFFVDSEDTAFTISCIRWGASALYEGFNHYMKLKLKMHLDLHLLLKLLKKRIPADDGAVTPFLRYTTSTDKYKAITYPDIKILLQSVLLNYFEKSDVLLVTKSIQKSLPPGFKFVANILTFLDKNDKNDVDGGHVVTACSSSHERRLIKTIEEDFKSLTKARYRNQSRREFAQLSVYIRLPSSVATFGSKNGSVVTATAARSPTGVLRGSAVRSPTGVLRGSVTGTVTSPWV
jgi:hypothetical protein